MKKITLNTLLFTTLAINAFGYDDTDDTLGNIAIEAGIWNTKLGGSIQNTISTTDFRNDLGFDEKKNVTSFGLDLKNEYWWLPNIYVNYFGFNSSANGTITPAKQINIINGIATNYQGSVSSTIEYSELNTILYGYLQQSIFQFDLGLNLKKIDYTQTLKENIDTDTANNDDDSDQSTIKGPQSVIPLPYIGFKVDIYPINTVLKAEASVLAFGDDEAKDYKYSINYRIMKNMYISYGYRYHSWKTTNEKNPHEKYDMNIKGNYINAKILF